MGGRTMSELLPFYVLIINVLLSKMNIDFFWKFLKKESFGNKAGDWSMY